MRHLIASTLYWGTALSCGVLVHNEVLHRSTHLFSLPNSVPDLTQITPLISPLLLSPTNTPFLQSGAFFPDWGYQCLSTDSAAEAAHWPPFLVASVEHIISKYGYLNDTTLRSTDEQEHLEGLISFIFAIAGHQTQDASWHAIRLPSGLLAALAAVDFGGDEEKAHRVLDFGGDFMVAARLARMGQESRAWIGGEWKVPIDDIMEIYKRMGREVNKFVLRYCTMRGLAALRSDLAVGPSLLDSMASQSPMLVNSLDDYYLGGLDEMTSRTVSCWSNLTRWFANGIDPDEKIRNGWGICDVFRAIKARGGAGDTGHSHAQEQLPLITEYSNKELKHITVHTDQFGVETYTLPPLSPPPGPVPAHPPHPNSKAPKFSEPTYIATYTPYARFGSSLSVGAFTPDSSKPSLAVGAPTESEDSSRPGEGNVYVLPLSDFLSSSSEPTPFSALQPEYVTPQRVQKAISTHTAVDQRFGTASTAWKTQGMTLLAVSAPGPLSYEAATPSLPFTENGVAGRIDVFRPGEGERWVSLSIKGAELGGIGRRWWGEEMIAADLDGSGNEWLVVSGSRSDAKRVCEGRERVQMGEGEVGLFQLVPSSAALESNITITTDLHTTADLSLKTHHIPLPPSEKTPLPCSATATYESFGTALSFLPKSHTLLIAAGTGKTFAYRLVDNTPSLVFTIPSPSLSRTASLAAGVSAAGVEWIAVGSPDEDVDGVVQAGVVRLYALGKGDQLRLVAELVAEGEGELTRYAKFGRTIVADQGSGGVWVGSELWDGERGGVWWVDVDALLAPAPAGFVQRLQNVLGKGGVEEVSRVAVGLVMQGAEANARFAGSLAVTEEALVVGIPYAGVGREEQGERFYGAVAVYRRV
ncbi:uncharacterized protein LAJ45_05877 [Morchella importuna]|uniref:uncharacterized protein n=1 Tax=Morchella importuna TaxID=1174673 RepID=UPI001E8E5364|nr:uncharacterized protein LAJ45_05877 [Morchella importuna]KAH8150191.1 hypothetical protein LAJ45_05877 [Morchella importuna]